MLMRVYITLDREHRIVLPAGIRKALGIRPGDKLALTLVGGKQAKQASLAQAKPLRLGIRRRARRYGGQGAASPYPLNRNGKGRANPAVAG